MSSRQDILKVGFLNTVDSGGDDDDSARSRAKMQKYADAFDIVITGDGSMDPISQLVTLLSPNNAKGTKTTSTKMKMMTEKEEEGKGGASRRSNEQQRWDPDEALDLFLGSCTDPPPFITTARVSKGVETKKMGPSCGTTPTTATTTETARRVAAGAEQE